MEINNCNCEKYKLLDMAFEALEKLKKMYLTKDIQLQFYGKWEGAFFSIDLETKEETLLTIFSNKNRMKEVCSGILNY